MIERALFDDDSDTLTLRFANQRSYVYDGVPRAFYDALVTAPSAGGFFNRWIKGRFACRRLGRQAPRDH